MKNVGRCLGLIILFVLISRVEWQIFVHVLERSHIGFLCIALTLNMPIVFIKALRWRQLLSWQGYNIRVLDSFLFYLSSISLGLITPGRIGDFSKVFYLKKAMICAWSQGLSSVFVDRLLDFFLLAMLALLGMLWLDPWIGARESALASFSGLVVCLILMLTVGDLKKTMGWIYRLMPKTKISGCFSEELDQFVDGLRKLFQMRLWQALILTALAYGLFFYQCFLIAQALNLPISYFALTVIMAMANLLALLPISIAGLGTREAALIFLLMPFGIGMERIMIYSISVFIANLVITGLMGALAWWFVD